MLNNKSAQTFYKTLRRGISETDASLYISNADLVGLAAAHNEKEQQLMAETLAAALPSSPEPLPPPPPPITSPGSDNGGPPSTPLPPAGHNLPPIGEQTPLLNESLTSVTSNLVGGTFNDDGDDNSQSVGSNTAITGATGVTMQIEETSLLDTLKEVLSRCLQPPVVGAMLGLIVASTPLRGIFVDLVNRADAAPLEWAFDGLCEYNCSYSSTSTAFECTFASLTFP